MAQELNFGMMYGVVIVHSRRFMELFGFSSVKDSSIADVLWLSNGVPHWDVRLSRLVQDWELGVFDIFYGSYLFQVC